MTPTSLIHTPEEISSEWLGAVMGLADLEVLGTERIGTGQMSQNHRVSFTSQGAPGVDRRQTGVRRSRRAVPQASGLGAYFRRSRSIATSRSGSADRSPRCHAAEYDAAEGWFTLVLEDIADAYQGDQIAGCGVEEARVALRGARADPRPGARRHRRSARPTDLNLPNPLNQALLTQLLGGFLERYRRRIAPEHADAVRAVRAARRCVGRRSASAARPRPRRLPARQPAVRHRDAARSSTGRRWAGARRCSTPRTSSAARSASRTAGRTSASLFGSTTSRSSRTA